MCLFETEGLRARVDFEVTETYVVLVGQEPRESSHLGRDSDTVSRDTDRLPESLFPTKPIPCWGQDPPIVLCRTGM